MSYNETQNYKLSARLKLTNRSASTKVLLSVLFVALLFSGGVYFSDSFKTKMYDLYYNTTSGVYGGVRSLNTTLSNKAEKVSGHFNLEERLNELKEENQKLKAKQIYYRTIESELSSLKNALKYAGNDPKKILMTEILMQSADGYVEAARIPVGDINGVKKGDVVVDGEKLVGRITDVGERFSKVMLVTSPNSKVPVFFEKTNLKAIVRGNYDGKLAVEIMHGDGESPKLDELVTASGDGYHFPSGVVIGKVTSVEDGKIEISPFFDLRKVKYVSILRD